MRSLKQLHRHITIHNISIGRPFAIGQCADILFGELRYGSGKFMKVAVKVLRAVPYDDEGARNELRQSLEANMHVWRSLKHPNVSEFLGLTYDAPFPAAIVMPYYAKGNSLSFVRREEKADILKLVYGAARGLRYLHERSPPIIHADIRACNVLVDDDNNARLVDYGLVPALSTTTFTTTSVVGPARWQAPEVFTTDEDDTLPFTVKTDVFSFAMFVVEILTKDRPFNHRKIDTVVIVDITRNLRPRKPVGSYLADQLWPLLQHCWAQAPDNRPAMSTVCEGLERIESRSFS